MKKIVFASMTLLLAANMSPAAFAKDGFKEKCAVSHGGGNWNNAPDSCATSPVRRHHSGEVLLIQTDHGAPPSGGGGKRD